MADIRFRGSGVALVTPFDEEGVNERVLRQLVRFHVDGGTDALIICGSTGEAATMRPDEQRAALEIVAAEAAGAIPVIMGCGGSDTAAVAQLGARARQAGADAVLLSAPPYNKPTQRGLIAHFRAVMDAADLPVMLYNVPGRTAVNILPETIAEIARDERVFGVKEASADISQIAEVARLLPEHTLLYSGNDDQTVATMALGGQGVVSVLGNVVPQIAHDMAALFLAGDVVAARDLQLRYLPLIRTLFIESNPIPVKAAVGYLGFDVGPVRLPLVDISGAAKEALLAALREAGVAPCTP